MILGLPTIWGGGSTFAYSALDGENLNEKALYAHLLSDRLGISFDTPFKAVMYVALKDAADIIFEVVASDIIKANIVDKDSSINSVEIIFIKHNVILVKHLNKHILKFCFEDEYDKKTDGNLVSYTSKNGTFAIYSEDNGEYVISSVAYGDDAEKDAKVSFTEEINKEISEKLDFFAKLPIMDNIPKNISNLASKCFSVLKSHIVSKKGSDTKMLSERVCHKRSYAKDNVLSSMALKYISPDVAKETLFSVLDTMNDDGSIPLFTDDEKKSDLCTVPCISWAFLKLFEYTNDISCLSESFDRLKKHILYYIETSDGEKKSLFEWKIKISDMSSKCEESSMDNSPRFDNTTKAYSVDIACFIANEAKSISKIAEILNKSGEHLYWSVIYDRIKEAINKHLYDDEDKFYYDKDASTNEFIKVKTSSAFLPLFAGICDKRQAEDIVEKHLFNKEEFFTPFMLPSTALNEETFETDMWCGCVFAHINYFVSLGFLDYVYKKEAQKIINDTVMNILNFYENDGVVYEYYDPLRKTSPSRLKRKGESIFAYLPDVKLSPMKDSELSCTVCAQMIVSNIKQNNE